MAASTRWLGAGVALLLVSGLAGAILAPALQSRQIPERWREGRWETTPDGLAARKLTESVCGPFAGDAWIDYPEAADLPLARDATPEFTACFTEKVAPRFARDRLLD